MDNNNNIDGNDENYDELEIPTRAATLAIWEGFEEGHEKWVKNQARLEKYRDTRRKTIATEIMKKRIVRRNRKKTHGSDYDSDDDSADYTTDEEEEELVPEQEETTSTSNEQEVDNNSSNGVPEEETTSTLIVQQPNNNSSSNEVAGEETASTSIEQEVNNTNTNDFNNGDTALLAVEDRTTSQPQQTATQSPFSAPTTNPVPVRPTNMWKPSVMKIPHMPGQPDIDIMDAYTLPPNPNQKYELLGPEETTSIWLPPSIYPPHWDQKHVIFNAIVKAAKDQSNTVLISGRTRTTPNKHKEMSYILICSSGRSYYAQGAAKEREMALQSSQGTTNHLPKYAPGLRMDRMVNKKKGNRGTQLHEGKSKPRRKVSSKPVKGRECKFRVHLRLLPGKYWRIAFTTAEPGCHNHMMLQKNELNIPSSRLTAAEKQIGASAMRYAGSGGAQNMMTDLSQHTLSASQLRRVREQNEEDGTTKNSSAATKVMEYLRHEANLGKKSYKALFHEVSESSLVAVKKAKQKKQRDKKRKIDEQVQEENSTLETPNQQVAATYNNNDDRDLLDELTSHTVQLQVSSPGTEGTPEDSEPYNLSTSKEKLALGETLASLSDTLRVGQKILLGVAWCRKDEQKLFELFPEVLMFDVTFGTNTESRPLGVSASMDGNMNVFTPFRVFMPECAPFCEDCTDDVICGLCHKNSPIIRLKRRRIITTQLCALSARYIVRCSCPYQPTFGIPCRHVCKLLRIKKEHVFVRWHTEYAALYHRTGHESRRKGFSSMRYDHTLSIDKVEYSEMLRLAQESQTSTVDIDSINLFRVPFEAHQKMKHGVVPSQLFADDDVDDSYDTNELVLVDSELSQELGGGMTQEEGGNGTINDSHFNSHTMRTGNRYIDMNSQLQYMYGMLETDTAMLNNFEQKLQSIITEFHQQMHLNNRTKADTTGEFVSFFPAVDKRRVYQRKKSRFERTRKGKRKQKPVYSKITKWSNDSMMV